MSQRSIYSAVVSEEVYSQKFFDIKSNYIHQNPVRAGIVEKEEEYIYSSAGDFYGIRKGLIPTSQNYKFFG